MKEIYASVRTKWTPGRVIAALTALLAVVAAPIGAFIATWTATHFPGLPHIDQDWVAGIFLTNMVAIVAGVVTVGFKRLDGQMQYERLVADPEMLTEEKVLKSAAPPPTGAVKTDPEEQAEVKLPSSQKLAQPREDSDDDEILSLPGEDIAESDVDDADELERRERAELDHPE